jgi:hypothetical protein
MLIINKATYGGADVTNKVRSLVKDNKLIVKASNDIFGDTNSGTVKYLNIDSSEGVFSVKENGYISLPKDDITKLGIFYSNNNVPVVVKESLLSLEKFKDIADILTCIWSPIPGNPFYEVTAMTKSSNHLNIVIQILQLLYTARETNKYKYVSFLEHDVLYPEGYFDFPEFSGAVMTNMNYKGICDRGWQKRNADHEPLHQMTMVFSEAIVHFENLLKEAIRLGGILVEPDIKRLKWTCVNPAVHINHGKHFTSHFSIYSKNTEPTDSYWGDAKTWIDKLFK